MNLRSFADYCNKNSIDQFFKDYSRICFTAKEYPLLFFSLLWHKFRRNKRVATLQHLDSTKQDYALFLAQLEVTFLGQKHVYWLGNVAADGRLDKNIEHYLCQYDGPNTVLFFMLEQQAADDTESAVTVTLPDQVELSDGMLIARLVGYDTSAHTRFIQELFKQTKSVGLDNYCLLLEYASLLSGDTKTFFDEYLYTLIAPQQSLFTLSQYFFAKQEKQFFAYWAQLQETYSPPFWCSFWSEQLWRAYYYIYFTKTNNSTAARTISFRLPFSFLKKDWKNITLAELQQAHEKIYAIDHAIKNGGDPGMLDVFYATFFF